MNASVRIEKRKWDGRLSATVEDALLIPTRPGMVAWFVPAGTERTHPMLDTSEHMVRDELWVTVSSQWWVLCAEAHEGPIVDIVVHAAAPVDFSDSSLVAWIDLDLDLTVHGDAIDLEDEAQFHRNAKTMAYPRDVIRGAWTGVSTVAPRYTTRDWPFDGWLDRRLAEARATLTAAQPANGR